MGLFRHGGILSLTEMGYWEILSLPGCENRWHDGKVFHGFPGLKYRADRSNSKKLCTKCYRCMIGTPDAAETFLTIKILTIGFVEKRSVNSAMQPQPKCIIRVRKIGLMIY
jgi:hypothetical protein